MLHKIKTKFITLLCLVSLMGGCSIAGAWVYDRLDDYINDYFFNFANFSNGQKEDIRLVTKNFKYWLTKNQLPEIQLVLNDIAALNKTSNNSEIKLVYEKGYKIFESINLYFDYEFIEFASSLDKKQINEMENHFSELQEERKEKREERKEETYHVRLLENYVSGFKRLGIKLKKEQKELLAYSIKDTQDNSKEWNLLQKKWTEEMFSILRKNEQNNFKKKLSVHLKGLSDLGSQVFKDKIEQNKIIGIIAVSNVVGSMDESQFKKMNKSLNVFQKSILQIIKNQDDSFIE